MIHTYWFCPECHQLEHNYCAPGIVILGEGLCQKRHQMMFVTKEQFDKLQKVPEKKGLIRRLLEKFKS